MLKLPGTLTPEQFLDRYWQKQPLFMPGALERRRPSVTRNELAWLATLDDVESRIIFVDRQGDKCRYRMSNGPFDPDYLKQLPKRNWTLLVHDVEKHLPAMRALLQCVPFIPDWRIDDLMVSFAVPGGGVGPHRDHYDVFLCQGIGRRRWRFTSRTVEDDRAASNDLALVAPFEGDQSHVTAAGDVLYLPPNVAHWGTAERACITYSIGMRAPAVSDLLPAMSRVRDDADAHYRDPDLTLDEATPGYLSRKSLRRAADLIGADGGNAAIDTNGALGCYVTQPKEWLKPDFVDEHDATIIAHSTRSLPMHGMARIAFDDRSVYVNGFSHALAPQLTQPVSDLCCERQLSKRSLRRLLQLDCGPQLLRWMLQRGAFDVSVFTEHM